MSFQITYLVILVITLVIYLFYYLFEFSEHARFSSKYRKLMRDGFCVSTNEQYLETTGKPCKQLERDILHLLPPGYVFLDYVYVIENNALSTFHRDVTSSQRIYKTKHPTYTTILYKTSGDLLSLCPHSNTDYPFVHSRIVNISGNKGTAILFNCDMLHAGMINKCKNRTVIQYKLCHRDDIHKMSHLNGIKRTKTAICRNGMAKILFRKLSYYFQMPINVLFYPLMTRREKTGFVSFLQSFIPLSYYNNV
jgi:hypothetical protein